MVSFNRKMSLSELLAVGLTRRMIDMFGFGLTTTTKRRFLV
jgi:hypothetical protein